MHSNRQQVYTMSNESGEQSRQMRAREYRATMMRWGGGYVQTIAAPLRTLQLPSSITIASHTAAALRQMRSVRDRIRIGEHSARHAIGW